MSTSCRKRRLFSSDRARRILARAHSSRTFLPCNISSAFRKDHDRTSGRSRERRAAGEQLRRLLREWTSKSRKEGSPRKRLRRQGDGYGRRDPAQNPGRFFYRISNLGITLPATGPALLHGPWRWARVGKTLSMTLYWTRCSMAQSKCTT